MKGFDDGVHCKTCRRWVWDDQAECPHCFEPMPRRDTFAGGVLTWGAFVVLSLILFGVVSALMGALAR